MIAVWGIPAEALSLRLLSRVPIDVGLAPDTHPVVLLLVRIVVLMHYPVLVFDFSRFSGSVALFWPTAFLMGYLEITLAAIAIYWSAVAVSRVRSGV